jgi:hypothetical protein
MPDPRKLKVGDRVQFVCLPDEWSDPRRPPHPESVEFMEILISRRWPSRIARLDASGYPWIHARLRKKGTIEYQSWMITETTGWRKVKPRASGTGSI